VSGDGEAMMSPHTFILKSKSNPMTYEALLKLCAQLSADNVQLRETIRILKDDILRLETASCCIDGSDCSYITKYEEEIQSVLDKLSHDEDGIHYNQEFWYYLDEGLKKRGLRK
jgi:hypothetical protein